MALHDVPADELIAKTAESLKKDIKPPEWSMFVKTGHTRERPPTNPDWWYVRAASMLRKIALIGPIGTEKLRTHYGGRKNLGHAPEHAYKGSGSVIREVLQQLDAAGLTKQVEKGNHRGRVVTPKGQALLYSLSDIIIAARPKKPEQPKEAVAEQPAQPAPKRAPKKAKVEPAAESASS